MSAISGTRRALKELVDGTIRVQIDIDPRFKTQFHQMFPNIDMPVALAPLVSDFEQREEEKPKGGPLCKLAAMWCKNAQFHRWITEMLCETEVIDTEAEAAQWMRDLLEINSRSEIDDDQDVAERFHSLVRAPFMEWLKEQDK